MAQTETFQSYIALFFRAFPTMEGTCPLDSGWKNWFKTPLTWSRRLGSY